MHMYSREKPRLKRKIVGKRGFYIKKAPVWSCFILTYASIYGTHAAAVDSAAVAVAER